MNRPSALSRVYHALALVGLLATWYHNAQDLLHGGGLGPQAFFGSAFANPLTTSITIDVYLSGLVFALWVVTDAKRLSIKRPWIHVLICFGVGLAVSLPFYLARREKALAAAQARA